VYGGETVLESDKSGDGFETPTAESGNLGIRPAAADLFRKRPGAYTVWYEGTLAPAK